MILEIKELTRWPESSSATDRFILWSRMRPFTAIHPGCVDVIRSGAKDNLQGSIQLSKAMKVSPRSPNTDCPTNRILYVT